MICVKFLDTAIISRNNDLPPKQNLFIKKSIQVLNFRESVATDLILTCRCNVCVI